METDAMSPESQSFCSITSVDLITAFTISPFFSSISSALRRVMTLSMRFFPTRTVTCAITSPILISVIFPLSWLRAESGIRGFLPQRAASPRKPLRQPLC